MTSNRATTYVSSALNEVALIDAKTAAAAGGMSESWWHSKVASGEAPAPAIRRPRCTRYRLSDVSKFWRDFAEKDDHSDKAGAKVLAHAAKASAAAQSKRRAAPVVAPK